MCGRFTSTTPVDDVASHFSVDDVVTADLGPRFNVAPTDEIYAVADHGGRRRLGTARWGLVPGWSAGPGSGPPLINARAETLTTRRAFREAFQRRRCVVPADGFYEWRTVDGRKQAWYLRPAGGGVLAFAGLWAVWRSPDGARRLTSCSIVTTAANRRVAPLHDRMPVVLSAGDWDEWLDPSSEPDHLGRLLVPAADDLLDPVPVGPAVNSVANDGPHLVEPVAPAGTGG